MKLPWDCHNQSQDTNWRHCVTEPELPFFHRRKGVLKIIDLSVKMPWQRLSMGVASSCSSAPVLEELVFSAIDCKIKLLLATRSSTIGSLRNDESNRNDIATNQWFDWLNEKIEMIVLHVRHAFYCQTTWNFHICDSDDNTNPQQKIFHSFPLHENPSCQASESTLPSSSTLRLVCMTWPTWLIAKLLT